jgi:ketosteroid isomerase-like protein
MFLDGRVYRGPEGFREWWREMDELFEWQRFEPVAVRMADENNFAVLGRLKVKGVGSGVELDEPVVHVFEQRDGKIVRQSLYSDASRALASIGLTPLGVR